jgi:hypothetical protein
MVALLDQFGVELNVVGVDVVSVPLIKIVGVEERVFQNITVFRVFEGVELVD